MGVGVDDRWNRYDWQVSADAGVAFFRFPLASEPAGGMAGFESSGSDESSAAVSLRA